MSGLELWTSGVRSDHFANWATTTALQLVLSLPVYKVRRNNNLIEVYGQYVERAEVSLIKPLFGWKSEKLGFLQICNTEKIVFLKPRDQCCKLLLEILRWKEFEAGLSNWLMVSYNKHDSLSLAKMNCLPFQALNIRSNKHKTGTLISKISGLGHLQLP